MPTPRSWRKARDTRTGRRYFQEQALRRTRTFQKFLQDNQDWICREIEDEREADESRPAALRSDYNFDNWAMRAFLDTEEGWELAQDFGLLPLERLACRVIPHQKAMIQAGRVEFKQQHLRDGRFLMVEIDLNQPRAVIDQALDFFFERYKIPVETKTRGQKVEAKEKTDKIFLAFDLVEQYLSQGENFHQSLVKATIEICSKIRPIRLSTPPTTDRRYQQVKRWHATVKKIVDNT